MKIYINKYFKDNRLEKFLDFEYEVYSRSGINETEKRLIKKLPGLNEPKKILILENRTAVIGMIANDLFPEAEVTVQNVDKFHSDKIRHNLKHNEVSDVKVLCEADVSGKYDAIYYQQTQANLVKEFVLDLVQQCHTALKKGGKLFLAMEKKEKVITEKMQQLFGGATIDNLTEKGLLLIGKKKNNPVEYVDYRADFVFSTKEGGRIAFRSYPGVFAHLTGWARETIEDSSSSRFVWSEWNPKTTKWNVAAHRFQNGHFPNGVIYEKRLAGLRPSYLFSPIAAQELTDDQKSEINFNPSSGFQPENHNQYNISGGLTFRPVISRRGNSY
jgi:hypothetical protein